MCSIIRDTVLRILLWRVRYLGFSSNVFPHFRIVIGRWCLYSEPVSITLFPVAFSPAIHNKRSLRRFLHTDSYTQSLTHFVVTGLHFALTGLHFALTGLHFILTGLRFALTGLYFALMGLPFALTGLYSEPRCDYTRCGTAYTNT